MGNHPNRRSVNADFFGYFLNRLIINPNPGYELPTERYTQEEILEVMRQAALSAAIDRVSMRHNWPKPWKVLLVVNHNGDVVNRDKSGKCLRLTTGDEDAIRQEIRRLVRGLPHWLPKPWEFLP